MFVGAWFVGTVYTVRFATELALFGAVAFGGYRIGDRHLGSVSIGAVLAVTALAVALGCWAVWIAPRAGRRLDDPLRFGTEMALFAWGSAALVAAGWTGPAIGLAITAVMAAVAIRWTGEPVADDTGSATERPVR